MTQDILHLWGLKSHQLIEDLSRDSPRIIHKIKAQDKLYILKGLSGDIDEAIIQNNTSAHLFLGNKKKLAPSLVPLKDGTSYVRHEGFYFYLLEYVAGRHLLENEEEEFLLGEATRQLHTLEGYERDCSFNSVLGNQKFKDRFHDRTFKKEYDQIIDEIPNLESYGRCFIHTDIGPYNTLITPESKVIFIDLDDAGIGARYSDLGWSFIMRYVEFNRKTHDMTYRFDLAKAFLKGYYGDLSQAKKDLDLIWQGAIHTHIAYMEVYGPDAVESLWKILKFGIQQKEKLEQML